jgi:DNA-binding beta-propeller fold protein YncE
LGIHDAATLQEKARVPVVPNPEDVAVLPDNSVAFVLSRTQDRISVVDLRRGVLLTNLQLNGKPSQMILKPDGGELYVISPEAHGLQAINTWTHEVGDYVLLGSAPTDGVLLPDASGLFVSDRAADRIAPVDIVNRKVMRPIPAGQSPGALAFDSNERPSLLLAVNQGSGDLAVVRISTDSPGLLTMIPVGDTPGEIVVKLFQ